VKIFVLNNSGYGIITQFQDSYFEQRYYATRFTPIDFVSIAKGYGMSAIRISELTDIDIVLEKVFAYEGPILVDVCIQATQKIYPKLEFGNSLEHMTPFIPLHELENIMITEVATRIEPKGWVRV
jgi:acetolactate synthase I/II/III large subunit